MTPARRGGPDRLVSLWDIMNDFDAKTMAKRLADFAYVEAAFDGVEAGAKASSRPRVMARFRKGLSKGIVVTTAIGMKDAPAQFLGLAKLIAAPDLQAPAVVAHAQAAQLAMRTEMGLRKFLYVPEGLSWYVDNDQLFGEIVWRKFPTARRDIKEAGNCLAADCNTAAVFQLMRASEHGLRAIARKLHIDPLMHKGAIQPIEYADWEKV